MGHAFGGDAERRGRDARAPRHCLTAVTYSQAIQFLYRLRLFGAKFGLENTLKLAALAGHPQKKLRFIHVAGTNGKGSTCAMLESIYRAAGLRVGLFTSPHLVSFRERIQIGRQWISESDVVRLVERFRALAEQFPSDHHPTFFEVVTVMALDFFAEQKCDLVIWETGLGGRLDATNIVTPLACVITNIALDHQQWLGDTLEKIAFEKAGIIKPGVPIATAAKEPALSVIEKIAVEKNAPLIHAGQASCLSSLTHAGQASSLSAVEKIKESETGGMPVLPLPGEHQKQNAALAMAVVNALQTQIPVTDAQLAAGLQSVDWPGRLQVIHKGGRKILLDGAHNVAGAKVLRETIEWDFPGEKTVLVLGILEDKDWRRICEMFAPLAEKIFAVPVSSKRTANPKELAEACRAANPSPAVFICESLNEALQKTAAEKFIVITGSLYLVGEALELLGYFPSAKSERDLNEWSGANGLCIS